MNSLRIASIVALILAGPAVGWCQRATTAEAGEVTFSTAFEGASLGRIEKLGEAHFRVHVLGQQDERGRNRAATWYCFRMDHVRRRDLTIVLTDLWANTTISRGRVP